METEVQEVEVEVLPPEPSPENNISRLLAYVLDDLFPIPGTSHRVGIDPLIGLIPGVGDASSSAFASVILFQSLRAGVPKIVLARMTANILVNALVGAIPGIGDVFSAWFKSNKLNYALLQRHANRTRTSTHSDWLFLLLLLSILLLGVLAAALLAGFMAWSVIQFLFQ